MDMENIKTQKRIEYVLNGNGKTKVQKRINRHAACHSATVKETKERVFLVIRKEEKK